MERQLAAWLGEGQIAERAPDKLFPIDTVLNLRIDPDRTHQSPLNRRLDQHNPPKAHIGYEQVADENLALDNQQRVGFAIVVRMLREGGASIAELGEATNWQQHSVRGVLTAVIKGRLSLPLFSEKGATVFGFKLVATVFDP